MPVQACPNAVTTCRPCDDFPLVNESAEAPDLPVFFAIAYYNPDIPGNNTFAKNGCKSWCFSTVSQAEADACALAQAQECVVPPDPGGGGGPCAGVCEPDGDTAGLFGSDPQTCAATCSDGSTLTCDLPADAYRSFISVADANARAASLCRQFLRLNGSPFCEPLTAMCFDPLAETSTEYQFQFPQSGGSPPWTYAVVAGAPPAGFTLEAGGYLHGFPSVSGSTSFTIRATDQTGASFTHDVTLRLVEITSPTELTDAAIGIAYTETLTQVAALDPVSWQIVPDVGEGLPPGLTLNETTGEISGTPEEDPEAPADGIYHFRVRLQDEAT